MSAGLVWQTAKPFQTLCIEQKDQEFYGICGRTEYQRRAGDCCRYYKRLEDIYIEDWNDRLQEKFLRDITKIRQKTEAAKEDAGLENGQKEIFLKTADGAEIHKYYDADVKDSTSEFLKNMIEEALDNFGDSLETNQKVAVLAEALEKLLQ